MKEWIKHNIYEIKQSPTLRVYGLALAFSHILTHIYWSQNAFGLFNSTGRATILCWSFFPQCEYLNFLTSSQIHGLFYVYMFSAGVAFVLFLIGRGAGVCWFFLSLCLLFKLTIYLLDFSLANNIHLLLFFVSAVYLFVPQKTKLINWMIVAFYLNSAILKFNGEWLAGYWLSSKLPHLPTKAIEWIAALILLVELVCPWLLLSKNHQRFLSGLIPLIVVQVFLVYADNYFSPVIQIVFLIGFFISFLHNKRQEREHKYQSFLLPEPSRAWIPLGLAIYVACQVLPLAIAEGKHFEFPLTLRALPVPKECHQFTLLHFKNKIEQIDMPSIASPNLRCHPDLRFQQAKTQCRAYKTESDFLGLSSYFLSRSYGTLEFIRVFEYENICDPNNKILREVN